MFVEELIQCFQPAAIKASVHSQNVSPLVFGEAVNVRLFSKHAFGKLTIVL
jgi:hypothetical protein